MPPLNGAAVFSSFLKYVLFINRLSRGEEYMNRYIMMVLLLAGMGLGAGIVGPAARNLLTDAHAATGELINFTVETSQGVVALKTKKVLMYLPGGQGYWPVKVDRIEPNPNGENFKAFLSYSGQAHFKDVLPVPEQPFAVSSYVCLPFCPGKGPGPVHQHLKLLAGTRYVAGTQEFPDMFNAHLDR
jgi:hypothetical protein